MLDSHKVSALIDSGASTLAIISQDFVNRHSIPLENLDGHVLVKTADGSPLGTGYITHRTAPMKMKIVDHEEMLQFLVLPIPHVDIILGHSWLQKHNPRIDWRNSTIHFDTLFQIDSILMSADEFIQELEHEDVVVEYIHPCQFEKKNVVVGSIELGECPNVFCTSLEDFKSS